MNRRRRQLFNLLKRLEKERIRSMEIFEKQHPYLVDYSLKMEPVGLSDEDIEEKIDNDYATQEILSKIEDLVKQI